MPSSHHLQLNEIMDLIIRIRPKKMLDIGIGFGKYGFLSREYLELWDATGSYDKRKYRIDGIEAYDKYLTPVHREIYDSVYTGNALDILPGIEEKYELILLVDVFEHFTEEEGWRLLDVCRKKADNILISVPKDLSVQEEVFDNPYETHKYPWKEKDFKNISDKFILHNERSLIILMGKDSLKIGAEVRRHKKRRTIISVLEFFRIKNILKKILKS